jgi:hypothetical protein
MPGESFPGHATLITQSAYALTELPEIGVGVAAAGDLGTAGFHRTPGNMHYIAKQ